MHTSLSHVALLVPSVEKSAAVLQRHGLKTGQPETFDSEGTKEVYVGSSATQRGLLLLLEAIADGPYRRALTKRGPSLHHIAIDVLDVKALANSAVTAGWSLHPASERTMAHKTAWLYCKGVPTLIEVHQKNELRSEPLKISKLEIPLQAGHGALFAALGLSGVVSSGDKIALVIDGRKFAFDQIAHPEPTLYELLGGEEALRKIVARFYQVMDEMPEVRVLREMHVDLPRAEEKLFDFLSGWTGGPPRFVQKHGHPMLRARHLPFKIGKSERDQWMICMVKAVEDCGVEEPLRSEFLHALLRLADHMRNQDER